MTNFELLREYVLGLLYEKVEEAYDKFTKVVNLRNTLAFLIRMRDNDLNDALETFLAKDRDPHGFLVLVEEEVKAGIDVTRSIDLFVSLFLIHQYSIDTIEKFINIVGLKHKGLISRRILKKLVESKREKYLVEFIKRFPEYRSLLTIL
jgi:hypothetical protein